jgi:quinol monooxygenase YgiN
MTRSHLYLRARAGSREDLLAVLDRLEILAAVGDQPGFLGAELHVPFDDDEHVLIWTAWASREHYERWLAGPSCADLLREVGPLVAEDPVFRLYHVVETVQ